ncbi:MAG: hypothetical protein HY721_23145 [Planctomycetes bacterium]|nr:hypothetical protein [Planctomycetota bacterium]
MAFPGWLLLGAPAPACLAAANSNGDAAVDISDATYLLSHIFLGRPPPAAPFPACGPNKITADEEIGCRTGGLRAGQQGHPLFSPESWDGLLANLHSAKSTCKVRHAPVASFSEMFLVGLLSPREVLTDAQGFGMWLGAAMLLPLDAVFVPWQLVVGTHKHLQVSDEDLRVALAALARARELGFEERDCLRDLVRARFTFPGLAERTRLPEKSLHRMLGARGNPTAHNLARILCAIARDLGLKTTVSTRRVRKSARGIRKALAKA